MFISLCAKFQMPRIQRTSFELVLYGCYQKKDIDVKFVIKIQKHLPCRPTHGLIDSYQID